jgi:hypothetical protein
MPRLRFWIGGALVALATTGIAMAAGPGATTDPVSATIKATKAVRVHTRTCKGADGSYQITRGIYEGDMTSTDSRLSGHVRMRIDSFYNTDKQAGWMRGNLKVQNGDTDSGTAAKLVGVLLDKEGEALAAEGLLTGTGRDPFAKLLANFSGTFTPGVAFDGQFGTTPASMNQAIFFTRGCVKEEASPATAATDEKATRTKKKHERPTTTERPAKQKRERHR